MRVPGDKIAHCSFLLERRLEPQNSAIYLTDTHFADDIALISSQLGDAQKVLNALETAVNSVKLYLNESKTEYFNLNFVDPSEISFGYKFERS